jgi:hypothetical protein
VAVESLFLLLFLGHHHYHHHDPIPSHESHESHDMADRPQVLVDAEAGGILHAGEFAQPAYCEWMVGAPKAELGDLMRVHDFDYLRRIESVCTRLPPGPYAIGHLDGDTAVSRESWEAALRAAGAVSACVVLRLCCACVCVVLCCVVWCWCVCGCSPHSVVPFPCIFHHTCVHVSDPSSSSLYFYHRRARRWTACCRGRIATPSAPCAPPVSE